MEEGSEDVHEFIDIPELFYSDLTDQPMVHCVKCKRDLLNGNEPYIIEKAFRYYSEFEVTNTIFEYIMCMPCAHEMHNSMSKDSLTKIKEFFQDVDLVARSNYLKSEYGSNFENWISECLINSAPRKSLEEYQICAQCIGDKMVFDLLPYMMSHEASDQITSLLSAQTLEEYNRFVDDNFGLPPEFKKALKDSPVLVT